MHDFPFVCAGDAQINVGLEVEAYFEFAAYVDVSLAFFDVCYLFFYVCLKHFREGFVVYLAEVEAEARGFHDLSGKTHVCQFFFALFKLREPGGDSDDVVDGVVCISPSVVCVFFFWVFGVFLFFLFCHGCSQDSNIYIFLCVNSVLYNYIVA